MTTSKTTRFASHESSFFPNLPLACSIGVVKTRIQEIDDTGPISLNIVYTSVKYAYRAMAMWKRTNIDNFLDSRRSLSQGMALDGDGNLVNVSRLETKYDIYFGSRGSTPASAAVIPKPDEMCFYVGFGNSMSKNIDRCYAHRKIE